MPSLGTLSTRLTLDNSGLERGAKESEATLGRLRGRLGSVAKAGAAMGVALGAAGVALTAALTKQGLAAVDAQTKLARSLNATADGVRAVQIAAGDAGIDGLEQSLNALNRRLGAVEMEGGPALETMDRLGLSASELANMDADERLAAIADAIKDSGMSAQESARHLQQLGFTQAEANDFFRQGGDAIRAARGEVEDYGLSLSEVDAAQVEAANDAFSRIGRVIEVIRQRLAVQLAPFIEYVADLINDAAKESGGFRDQIDSAISTGIRMGARMADIIEGVRRAFLLAGQASATMALMITERVLSAGAAIMSGPVDALNALIRTANRVPGVSISEVVQPDIVSNTEDRIAAARLAVEEGKAAMQETLMAPMPSTGLEQRLEEIRSRSREAAEQVVADRERMAAPEMGAETDGQTEEDEKHREQLERRLERMRESMMAEQELIEHRHAQALEELREFKEAELLTMEEFDEMERELEEKKQEELTRIAEDGEKDRHNTLSRFAKANQAIRENSIASETAALRSGLQTMFGDQKAAALAMGALKRFEAIASAYAWGSSIGGPGAGAAAAATAAAAQAATLSDMSSTSIGSSSAGSSQPAAGSTSAPAQQMTATVRLVGGDETTRRNAGNIAEQINELRREGWAIEGVSVG